MTSSNPDSRQIGQDAEKYAAALLRRRGYRILEENVRFRGGELDLVAEDGETLVFVEVRARRPGNLGVAEETLGVRKRRRIHLAIELYLQQRDVDPRRPLRIDVVAIRLDTSGKPVAAELITNAFGEM